MDVSLSNLQSNTIFDSKQFYEKLFANKDNYKALHQEIIRFFRVKIQN